MLKPPGDEKKRSRSDDRSPLKPTGGKNQGCFSKWRGRCSRNEAQCELSHSPKFPGGDGVRGGGGQEGVRRVYGGLQGRVWSVLGGFLAGAHPKPPICGNDYFVHTVIIFSPGGLSKWKQTIQLLVSFQGIPGFIPTFPKEQQGF